MMKTIAAVYLKNGNKNTDSRVRFLDHDFQVVHIETGGDMAAAADALEQWEGRADVLALENIRFPSETISPDLQDRQEKKINEICHLFSTPVFSGRTLLPVCRRWTLNQLEQQVGDDLFDQAAIVFTSGITDADLASDLLEYTDNFTFCDPILSSGIPKLLHTLEDLRLYAQYVHPFTKKLGSKRLSDKTFLLDACNTHIISKEIKNADILVVPHACFFEDIGDCGMEELEGKIVITAAVQPDRLRFLKQRGVRMIIDTIPKMTEKVFGPGVLEAMFMVASDGRREMPDAPYIENTISRLGMAPRVIYPFGPIAI